MDGDQHKTKHLYAPWAFLHDFKAANLWINSWLLFNFDHWHFKPAVWQSRPFDNPLHKATIQMVLFNLKIKVQRVPSWERCYEDKLFLLFFVGVSIHERSFLQKLQSSLPYATENQRINYYNVVLLDLIVKLNRVLLVALLLRKWISNNLSWIWKQLEF